MDGWNTTFLLGRPIFRGYVSFREGIFSSWNSHQFSGATFAVSFQGVVFFGSSVLGITIHQAGSRFSHCEGRRGEAEKNNNDKNNHNHNHKSHVQYTYIYIHHKYMYIPQIYIYNIYIYIRYHKYYIYITNSQITHHTNPQNLQHPNHHFLPTIEVSFTFPDLHSLAERYGGGTETCLDFFFFGPFFVQQTCVSHFFDKDIQLPWLS